MNREFVLRDERKFSVEGALRRIRHYLPAQAPLKDFIHHNTLHAFQDKPFDEAVREAGSMYGARTTLSVDEYLAFYRAGKINRDVFESILREKVREPSTREEYLRALHDGATGELRSISVALKLHSHWDELLGAELSLLIDPLAFRLVSQFLDQGIAFWPMPGADYLGFHQCIRQLFLADGPSLVPLTDGFCRELMSLSAGDAIAKALECLVEDRSDWEEYLWETALGHPGWSGMVSVLEQNPELLPKKRMISLEGFIALKLILEVGALRRQLHDDFKPLRRQRAGVNRKAVADVPALEEIFQEALEQTYYGATLSALQAHESPVRSQAITMQALFCLDDRQCSLRRHIETIDDGIETFGVAGFFGIDAMVLEDGELFPVKSCPAPMKPKHLILRKEGQLSNRSDRIRSLKAIQDLQGPSSKGLMAGLAAMPTTGLRATLRLVLDVMSPIAHAKAFGLDHVADEGVIHVQRQGDELHDGRYQVGYTTSEMAARVAGVLRQAGLVEKFAPVVFVVAHGSSSVNNPYFAAYDCGACSGKPGAPNSRAFAAMANLEEVRLELARGHGIVIPERTLFVAGIHDTCKDVLRIFGLKSVPAPLRGAVQRFGDVVEKALNSNALERCRRFELAPESLTPKEARRFVRDRALSIFEPRPELNHATNAACIVGRRELTRGLFLDRRAFLQSYDPGIDPSGEILAGILSAVVPVCGGINLEYYFSRIDPGVYGAGTKLPHNVVSLLGVVNGAEGDLLTGLPTQMTEMHDPIRLLLVIEQMPEIVTAILRRQPAIAEWVDNKWMQLAVIEPGESKKIHWYESGSFVSWTKGRTK